MTRALVAFIATAIALPSVGAQTQPESISRALLAEITGDTVLVGVLPPTLRNKIYLPATSRVIGAVGRTSMIVSTLPPVETLKALEREMPKLGWKLLLH